MHGRAGLRGLRLADVERAIPCHMRIDEIHGHASALHSFNFSPFAADYAHFFQRPHDGADVFGGTADFLGELVTVKQHLARILSKIEQHQIEGMADLMRPVIGWQGADGVPDRGCLYRGAGSRAALRPGASAARERRRRPGGEMLDTIFG